MIIEFKKSPFSKPSRFFRENAKIFYVLLAICIVASYFFIDKPFACFFASCKSDWFDILFLINRLFTPYFTLLILPSLFFYIRFVHRKERKSRKLWYLSFATVIAIFAASIVNVLIGRAKPDWFFLHKEMAFRLFDWNETFHSFPSTTSANIGALGAAFCYLFPKQSFKFFIGALLVGMIPAILTQCFFSDAIAGIFVGMIFAKIVFRVMRKELSFY